MTIDFQPYIQSSERNSPAVDKSTPSSRGPQFGQTLYTVQQGDTLYAIAKRHLATQGLSTSVKMVRETAHQIATRNAIANPDLILTGQKLELMAASPAAGASPAPGSNPAPQQYWQRVSEHATPVLNATLDRAAQRGYIPIDQQPAARQKILAMADRFGFHPDDFARIALIESDGFNPKATNGNCHGIVQFCDGPNRGAASVGMAETPTAILEMNVLDQLDLAEKYFEDVGLHRYARFGLADFYLSVLMPAARAERSRNAPLEIHGTQARVLHQNHDHQQPITRRSLESGLRLHAASRLSNNG